MRGVAERPSVTLQVSRPPAPPRERAARWPERLFFGLLAIIGALVALSVAAVALDLREGGDRGEHGVFIRMFDINRESNVPTWFSSVELLLGAAGLAWIAHGCRALGRPFARHWGFLALVFAFLSMDEVAMVHDTISGMITARIDTGGVLRYAWVVPYGVAVLALGACYLRFFWHLPLRSRALFALAATLYVGGALGFEMISGWWESHHAGGVASLTLTSIEETGEMLGSATFVYAVSDYVRWRDLGHEAAVDRSL
jgi:hypothetical protein